MWRPLSSQTGSWVHSSRVYSVLMLVTSCQGDTASLGYNRRKAESLQVWKALLLFPGEKMNRTTLPISVCQVLRISLLGFQGEVEMRPRGRG